MRRDAVGRHTHAAIAKQFKRGSDKVVCVAVYRHIRPDETVGVGRRKLVAERRNARHDLEGCASRGNGVCVKWRSPNLAIGNDLHAGQVVRAPGEHPAVLERKPKRILPRATNVPIRRFAFCETVLDKSCLDRINKINRI